MLVLFVILYIISNIIEFMCVTAGSAYRLMKNRIISYAFLTLALLFIIAGVTQSGYQDTLRRAAFICLECIGIG